MHQLEPIARAHNFLDCACLRSEGTLNVDVTQSQTNVVRQPRFYCMKACHEQLSLAEIIMSAFEPAVTMIHVTCCLVYRGDVVSAQPWPLPRRSATFRLCGISCQPVTMVARRDVAKCTLVCHFKILPLSTLCECFFFPRTFGKFLFHVLSEEVTFQCNWCLLAAAGLTSKITYEN